MYTDISSTSPTSVIFVIDTSAITVYVLCFTCTWLHIVIKTDIFCNWRWSWCRLGAAALLWNMMCQLLCL